MSKKNREDRTQDSLVNTNRELKAENRRLNKLVKKLSRGFKRTATHIENEDIELPVEVQELCFDCGGEFKKIEILGRSWRSCSHCGRRSRTKIT